jgi:glycosyltransferase involved in cell wall biosynthesis
LHEEVGFDVAHHVTFAAYWSRVGVRGLGIPLVVGPVGGGVRTPRGLWPVLGIRGMAEEALRTIGRASIASVISARATMHSAQVVLVQNQETANLLAPLADAVVLPNALSLEAGKEIPDRSEGGREIAFVGRLIAWKAAVLAVRTMGLLDDESISLHIYGEGPEKRRVVRAARRWGVADRVIFEGWLERDVLRSRLARAASLLHPALHEEAGFAVAEALAAGTPVVCLDHGGPAELIRRWSDARSQAIPPTRPRATAQAMSDAVCKVIRGGANGSEGEPPRLDYVATVLGAYERARG